MNELKLNETPIRTSRNFLINNIKLTDVEIPETVEKFKNIEIIGGKNITENIEKIKLTYGLGEILQNNIIKNSNSKLNINAENEEIKIIYNFDDENINLINNIVVNATKKCKLYIVYKSNTNKECFHNGVIKINALENSKIDVIVVNTMNKNSNNFEAYENIIESNASVNYTIIDIGGKNSITNYYSNILGEKAKNDLKTIYLGAENNIKDLNYIAELRGKQSFIDIDVQGALSGNAKKNFKGTIDFKKGCKKAKGNENEFGMLLSEKARSIALPMLLCTESDVEGNHSTASGKVDNQELFYIMSRGLSYNEAVKLIVKARFNKILSRIADEDLRNEIIEEIEERLD